LPLGLLAWQRLGAGGADLPARALVSAALVGWLVLLMLNSALRARARSRARAGVATPTGLGREALVLALGSVLGVLYQRLDLALLGACTDLPTVGLYFSAARWVECAYVVPFAVMLVLFPRLAARAPSVADWRRFVLGFAGAGLAAAAAVVLAALWVLPRVYARDGGALARWALALAPTVPLVFVGTFCGQALIARDRAGRALRAGLLSLAVNLLVAGLTIPSWGARGAAWAAFATEFTFATLAARELRRLVRAEAPPTSAPPLAPTTS
jgi:O-antigen/teichoic acid export membrane protein